MELSEFEIQYEPKTIIKAQVLANFLVEMVDKEEAQDSSYMLHVDGASIAKECEVDVILEKESNIVVELSIKFDFLVSSNQAESMKH